VRSRLTIGADGRRSLVAREVAAATLRSGTGSGGVVYGHWDSLPVDGYEWFYRPGVGAGLIPTNDGEVCVFASTSSERFRREIAGDVRAGYLRLLKEVAGDAEGRLHPGEAPSRLWAHPGQPAHVRRPWGPGWALVGDAGHYVDPLTTHGMTDALRDADLLADGVDALLRGEDEAVALAAYQSNRDRIAGPMFPASDEIGSYQWTLPRVRELMLELSAAMKVEVEALSAR
jgi:2-polyprenyl-6-methoxyphenol hydroxylase-like FAD-dependent oxidoreductase